MAHPRCLQGSSQRSSPQHPSCTQSSSSSSSRPCPWCWPRPRPWPFQRQAHHFHQLAAPSRPWRQVQGMRHPRGWEGPAHRPVCPSLWPPRPPSAPSPHNVMSCAGLYPTPAHGPRIAAAHSALTMRGAERTAFALRQAVPCPTAHGTTQHIGCCAVSLSLVDALLAAKCAGCCQLHRARRE